MAYQLLLTSDTLDIGRQKLNAFMQSSAGIWSSDTPNYSVISLQGTNTNTATGNFSFVTGKNNSGQTQAYQVIAGGTNNRVNGTCSSILGGKSNSQTNTLGKYNTIINGFSNTIAESDVVVSGIRRSYNTIINGASNSIDGQLNTIAAGNTNTIQGNTNFIMGSSNKVLKNSSFNSPTQKGPQINTLIGSNNNIVGGENWYYNLLVGSNHSLSSATGNFVASITSIGSASRINGPNIANIFTHGSFITNTDDLGNNRQNLMIFGNGTSIANPLRPKNNSSYQFVLGSAGNRRIRFRFDGTQSAYINGGSASWQTSGADYGEYFEWVDKNENSQDRIGYFVEIVDGKIKIANSPDVIGISSKTTAFIGDSHQDYWSEKYLKDEWGLPLKEKFEKYFMKDGEKPITVFFDSNGFCYSEIPNSKNRESVKTNVLKEQGTFSEVVEVEVENPNYDPELAYVPRNKRKEWEVIGLLGKLRVRTSEQITGNAVDVDVLTGMAKNGTKYPVLQKNKDFDGKYGIVTIFFK